MTELLQPYPPEDLAEFWGAATQQALSAPLDFRRSLAPERNELGHLVELFAFRGTSGEVLNGWIAYPEGSKRLPSFLWIPPYGRESVLPNAYGTRPGMTSLSFNFFGHEAMHQEKYFPDRGYFSEGAGDPETWIFRQMFQNAVLAARVLQSLPETDEEKIAACGMSQGGGISIWLGAWLPMVKAVCADMPFLGGLKYLLNNQVYRYPLKELVDFMQNEPLGEPRLMHTLTYFDTLNQATQCAKPTLVSMGHKDPAVKPIQARSIFEALPGPKKLVEYDWGHDWHEQMVENNQAWMLANL